MDIFNLILYILFILVIILLIFKYTYNKYLLLPYLHKKFDSLILILNELLQDNNLNCKLGYCLTLYYNILIKYELFMENNKDFDNSLLEEKKIRVEKLFNEISENM